MLLRPLGPLMRKRSLRLIDTECPLRSRWAYYLQQQLFLQHEHIFFVQHSAFLQSHLHTVIFILSPDFSQFCLQALLTGLRRILYLKNSFSLDRAFQRSRYPPVRAPLSGATHPMHQLCSTHTGTLRSEECHTHTNDRPKRGDSPLRVP